MKLLHILVLHLEYLDIILVPETKNLVAASYCMFVAMDKFYHATCATEFTWNCKFLPSKVENYQSSLLEFCFCSLFFLFVFLNYTLVIPLTIPKPADPSSLLLFLKLQLQRFTLWECGWLQILQFWQGFNWGNSHRYIFNNERADCTQAMIFMLTEIL